MPQETFKGRRIVCALTGKTHLELDEVVEFPFSDYSWACSACGGRHCSSCLYETDGETITVFNCGRWAVGTTTQEGNLP